LILGRHIVVLLLFFAGIIGRPVGAFACFFLFRPWVLGLFFFVSKIESLQERDYLRLNDFSRGHREFFKTQSGSFFASFREAPTVSRGRFLILP